MDAALVVAVRICVIYIVKVIVHSMHGRYCLRSPSYTFMIYFLDAVGSLLCLLSWVIRCFVRRISFSLLSFFFEVSDWHYYRRVLLIIATRSVRHLAYLISSPPSADFQFPLHFFHVPYCPCWYSFRDSLQYLALVGDREYFLTVRLGRSQVYNCASVRSTWRLLLCQCDAECCRLHAVLVHLGGFLVSWLVSGALIYVSFNLCPPCADEVVHHLL